MTTFNYKGTHNFGYINADASDFALKTKYHYISFFSMDVFIRTYTYIYINEKTDSIVKAAFA